MSNRYNKAYLVEVIQPGIAGGNNSTKIQILDQPYLRNKNTYGIQVFADIDVTKSPSQKTPITNAQLQLCFLTLYTTGTGAGNEMGEYIQNIPFCKMHQQVTTNVANTSYVNHSFELDGQYVDWSKSYITLGAAFANATDLSILLLVNFADRPITR